MRSLNQYVFNIPGDKVENNRKDRYFYIGDFNRKDRYFYIGDFNRIF